MYTCCITLSHSADEGSQKPSPCGFVVFVSDTLQYFNFKQLDENINSNINNVKSVHKYVFNVPSIDQAINVPLNDNGVKNVRFET